MPGVDPIYNKPHVPQNTIGSFNFTKDRLIIIDSDGNRVIPKTDPDRRITNNGDVISEVNIKFIQGSPCHAEICLPDNSCQTVRISEGECPTYAAKGNQKPDDASIVQALGAELSIDGNCYNHDGENCDTRAASVTGGWCFDPWVAAPPCP